MKLLVCLVVLPPRRCFQNHCLDACMSLDQETDTVILGSVSKASLEADLWIVNKDSQLSFKRNACQFLLTVQPHAS